MTAAMAEALFMEIVEGPHPVAAARAFRSRSATP
jgi:hypothetical protein